MIFCLNFRVVVFWCRGETFYHSNSFVAKCPYCTDIKDSIIDLMFELSCGDNELFNKRIKFFEFAKSLYLHY